MSNKVLMLYFWEEEDPFKQLAILLAHHRKEPGFDETSQKLFTSLVYLNRISKRIPSSRIISFGKFLKLCRHFLSEQMNEKFTLKKLAEKTGLSLTKVIELESDHMNKISVEEIFKLEKGLEAPLFLIISKFGHYSSWPIGEVEMLLKETADDRCCA